MRVLRIRFLISVAAVAVLSFASFPLSGLAYQSQRQNRENKNQQTPVKKGKKGVAASSKKAEPKKSAPATTTTASVPKAPPVTPSVAPPPTQVQPISVQPTVALPTPSTDKIDVIEYRKPGNTGVPVTTEAKPGGVHGISTRRMDVEIESHRVIQIQKALKDRGFYSSEPSGIYDDETIEGMKAFQVKERIDATGYPTAHALKRLGLSN